MLAASLLSGALGLLPLGTALACDCNFLEPPQALANAQVVLVGVATGNASAPAPRPVRGMTGTVHEFRVEEVIKGQSAGTAVVGTESSDCGMVFAAGQRWRLYLSPRNDGQLMTHQCAGNELLAEGVEPTAVSAEERPAEGLPTEILLLALVLVAGAAFSAWAFSRRSPVRG